MKRSRGNPTGNGNGEGSGNFAKSRALAPGHHEKGWLMDGQREAEKDPIRAAIRDKMRGRWGDKDPYDVLGLDFKKLEEAGSVGKVRQHVNPLENKFQVK